MTHYSVHLIANLKGQNHEKVLELFLEKGRCENKNDN